jgi:hypothetical protein
MRTRAISRARFRHGAVLSLFCLVLMVGISASAVAEPKGPNGEKCTSSETGVKHDIKGKHYTCDKCVVSSCSTSGGQISNCTSTTYWSNCVAAAFTRPTGPVRAGNSGVMAPPENGSSTRPGVNRPRTNKY